MFAFEARKISLNIKNGGPYKVSTSATFLNIQINMVAKIKSLALKSNYQNLKPKFEFLWKPPEILNFKPPQIHLHVAITIKLEYLPFGPGLFL